MDKYLQSARDDMKFYTERYKTVLLDTQLACTHEELLEREWYSYADWLPAHPPIRVCSNCGLSEEGWGCGYFYLKDAPFRTVTKTTKANADTYRRGKLINNSNKGKLLRGELSLREFLER